VNETAGLTVTLSRGCLCLRAVSGRGAEDSWEMTKCVLVFKRKSSTNVLELLHHNYQLSVARILYCSKTYILFLQTANSLKKILSWRGLGKNVEWDIRT